VTTEIQPTTHQEIIAETNKLAVMLNQWVEYSMEHDDVDTLGHGQDPRYINDDNLVTERANLKEFVSTPEKIELFKRVWLAILRMGKFSQISIKDKKSKEVTSITRNSTDEELNVLVDAFLKPSNYLLTIYQSPRHPTARNEIDVAKRLLTNIVKTWALTDQHFSFLINRDSSEKGAENDSTEISRKVNIATFVAAFAGLDDGNSYTMVYKNPFGEEKTISTEEDPNIKKLLVQRVSDSPDKYQIVSISKNTPVLSKEEGIATPDETEAYNNIILQDFNGSLNTDQDPRLVVINGQKVIHFGSTAFDTEKKVEYLKKALQNTFDSGACTQILVTELVTGKVTSITQRTANLDELVLAYQQNEKYSVTAFLSPQNPVSREIIDPLKEEFLSVSDNFSFPDALEFSMRLGADQKKYYLNNALLMAAFLELDENSGYALRCFKKPQGNIVSIKCNEDSATKASLLSNFCINPDAYTIVDVIKEQPIEEPKDPEFQLADGSSITLSELRAKIQDPKTPNARLYRNGEMNSWSVVSKDKNLTQVARENAYGIVEMSSFDSELIKEGIESVLKCLNPMSTKLELGKCSINGAKIIHTGHTLNRILKNNNELDWDEITSLENGLGGKTILQLALDSWRRGQYLRSNFEIEVGDLNGSEPFKPMSDESDKQILYKSIIDPDNYAGIFRPLAYSDVYEQYYDYVVKNIEGTILRNEGLDAISGAGSSKEIRRMKVDISNIDIFGPYYPSNSTLLQIVHDTARAKKKFGVYAGGLNGSPEVLDIFYNKNDFPVNISPAQNRSSYTPQTQQTPSPAANHQKQKTVHAYVNQVSIAKNISPAPSIQPTPNIAPQPKQPTQITTTTIADPRYPDGESNIIIGAADDGCFGVGQYQNGHHNPEVKAAIDALGWASTGYKNSNGLRNENYEAGQEWLANLLIHERFKNYNSNDPRYKDIYDKLNGQLIEPLAKHGAYLFGEVVYDPTHQIYISVLYNFTQGKDNMNRDIYFRRANWIVSKTKHDAQENLKLLTAHQQHEPVAQASPLNPQAQPGKNIYVGNKTMLLVNSNSLTQQNTPLDDCVKALNGGASGFLYGVKENSTVAKVRASLQASPILNHGLNVQAPVPANTQVNVAQTLQPNIANIQPLKPQNTLSIAGQTPSGKMIYCLENGVKAVANKNVDWVSIGFKEFIQPVLNMSRDFYLQNHEDFLRWTMYDSYPEAETGVPTKPDKSKKFTPNRTVTGQIYETDASGKIIVFAELFTDAVDNAGRRFQYYQQFFVETTKQDAKADYLALFIHIDRNYPAAPSPLNLPNKGQIGQQTINLTHASLQQQSPNITPVKPGIFGAVSLGDLARASAEDGFTSFIHGIRPDALTEEAKKLQFLTNSPFPVLLSFDDNYTAQAVAAKYPATIGGNKIINEDFSLLRKLKKIKYEEKLLELVKYRDNPLQTDKLRGTIYSSVYINYSEISTDVSQKVLAAARSDIDEFIKLKPKDFSKCLRVAIYSELYFNEPESGVYRSNLKQFISANQPSTPDQKTKIKNAFDTILDVFYNKPIDYRPASHPKYNLKPKINNLITLFAPWNLGVSLIP